MWIVINFKVRFSRLILKDLQPDASRGSTNSEIYYWKSRLILQRRGSWTPTIEKIRVRYFEDSGRTAQPGRFRELAESNVELDNIKMS